MALGHTPSQLRIYYQRWAISRVVILHRFDTWVTDQVRSEETVLDLIVRRSGQPVQLCVCAFEIESDDSTVTKGRMWVPKQYWSHVARETDIQDK